ncbi:hypothetical protein KUV89_02720 [Marinobacter hydrocarbonoclasticus]|nr:hypothetical protein [Marinobacter nauticus]
MAQSGRGEALVSQIAQAFHAEGRWSLFALAQREGDHVRLLAASLSGQAHASMTYPLSQSPCRLLYEPGRPQDALIFYPNLKRFGQWPLAHQFELGCYLGRKLDIPPAYGEFHLFIMDKLSRAEQELPKRLLVTAADRIAQDLVDQAQMAELNALRQVQQLNPFPFARVSPQGHLFNASDGLALRLGRPVSELNGMTLSEIIDDSSLCHVRDLIGSAAEVKRACRLRVGGGRTELVELTLKPIDSQLGYLMSFVSASEDAHSGFEPLSMGDQTLLHDRVQHELSRLHRNNQVAALFFIGVRGTEVSTEKWAQLNERLQPLLRSEDLIAQRDPNHLAVLTACFDNRGKPPREQMNAIAHKLYDQVRDWLPATRSSLVFKSRLLTPWDKDPAQILDLDAATDWVVSSAQIPSEPPQV